MSTNGCSCQAPPGQRHLRHYREGRTLAYRPLRFPYQLWKSYFQVPILEQVLVHVSECRSISQQIGTRANDPSDPTMSILCLYEYEARHSLGQPDSDTVLDQLASQPSPDPKMFETIAGEAVLV